MRDSRYDILFEPMDIGPVTAKNRFYQVLHCNGGGYRDLSAAAAMRGIKAEGGWGVIYTERCEMHHTSEITPFIELRLWEDKDIPQLRKMSEKMKQHGALAGIQLAYLGINGPNLYTKEVPLAVSAMPIRTFTNDPVQARALDKSDIRHPRSATVVRECGQTLEARGLRPDLPLRRARVRHLPALPEPRHQSAQRRIRRQPREPVALRERGHRRLGLFERRSARLHRDEPGSAGPVGPRARHVGAVLRPVAVQEEAAQEELAHGIRALTDKPIVGVDRFTSADTMVRQIKLGVLDFIGCARPSIADPFLPKKIEEGRIEDIRECIGCNICITGDMTMSISRCTQNPTFMEEWRKGWHPERMNPKGESSNVLVVGSGPAGLEAARGYDVAIAEAKTELGGRVARERRLWGLSAWGRMLEYREHQISQKPNVETYFDSELAAESILEFRFENVCIATGSKWRADGVSRQHVVPFAMDPSMPIYTPDDIMDGRKPIGKVVMTITIWAAYWPSF